MQFELQLALDASYRLTDSIQIIGVIGRSQDPILSYAQVYLEFL